MSRCSTTLVAEVFLKNIYDVLCAVFQPKLLFFNYIFFNNRPWDNIRGLSLESFIGITANITTQELRRGEPNQPPEHPREGTTDSCENFIGLLHQHLGPHFTLKELTYEFHRLAL